MLRTLVNNFGFFIWRDFTSFVLRENKIWLDWIPWSFQWKSNKDSSLQNTTSAREQRMRGKETRETSYVPDMLREIWSLTPTCKTAEERAREREKEEQVTLEAWSSGGEFTHPKSRLRRINFREFWIIPSLSGLVPRESRDEIDHEWVRLLNILRSCYRNLDLSRCLIYVWSILFYLPWFISRLVYKWRWIYFYKGHHLSTYCLIREKARCDLIHHLPLCFRSIPYFITFSPIWNNSSF